MPLSTVKDKLAQARRRLAGRLRPLARSLGVIAPIETAGSAPRARRPR
jgi:hypothetical protein